MIENTIEKLKAMRFSGFARALREQLESPQYHGLSFEERMSFLVDREFLDRENRTHARILREARLPQQATIEQIDFDARRDLKRSQLMDLAQCTWVVNNHNLVITGPTGVGKSFIASALADKACRLKMTARYFKTTALARELLLAQADGSYPKLVAKLARTHLLILEEWLRDPLSQEHAREILDLLDDRFRKRSTIFVSQLPVADWHQHILDPTLADAILDRIVHDAHRISLSGESMRKRTTTLQNHPSSEREDSSLRSD
jgi:DNA replication protein DnaC